MGSLVTPKEVLSRIQFWSKADRLGQDIPITYWRLFFKSEMRKVCKRKFAEFGEGSEFRPGAYADACSKIRIGRNIVIRSGTFLYADPSLNGGTITIEDDVLIGPGVHIYTNNHCFQNPYVPIIDQGYPAATLDNSITIKKGSWIGAGVILLPGVVIGENSVIGAGAVVTKSVASRTLSAGNPAREIKRFD